MTTCLNITGLTNIEANVIYADEIYMGGVLVGTGTGTGTIDTAEIYSNIQNTSNDLIRYVDSNIILTSNDLINYTNITSNNIIDYIDINNTNTSNYILNTSNNIIEYIDINNTNTSNNLVEELINLGSNLLSLENEVATDAASIATLQSEVSANTTAIATNTTAIGALQTEVLANTTAIAANTTAIGANTTAIAGNTTAIVGLATSVSGKTDLSLFNQGNVGIKQIVLEQAVWALHDGNIFEDLPVGGASTNSYFTLKEPYKSLPTTVSTIQNNYVSSNAFNPLYDTRLNFFNIYGLSNNVGIGTNNPTTTLDVYGPIKTNNNLTVSGKVGIGTDPNPGHELRILKDGLPYGNCTSMLLGTTVLNQGIRMCFVNADTDISWGTPRNRGYIAIDGEGHYGIETGAFIFSSDGSTNMIFATNGANERMRITAGGNVGIGTNNPSQKLHVNGNTVINGSLNVGTATVNTLPGTIFTSNENALCCWLKDNPTYAQSEDIPLNTCFTQLCSRHINTGDTIMPFIKVDAGAIKNSANTMVSIIGQGACFSSKNTTTQILIDARNNNKVVDYGGNIYFQTSCNISGTMTNICDMSLNGLKVGYGNLIVSNNIGIGTTNPQQILDIYNKSTSFNNPYIRINNIKQIITTTPTVSPITATDNANYVYYAFTDTTQTYTFTTTESLTADILIVGGGGSGGRRCGGGGGAGAVIHLQNQTLNNGTYTISVGKGGDSLSGGDGAGNNGNDSVITFNSTNIYIAKGGGGGGGNSSQAGKAGGSSGGSIFTGDASSNVLTTNIPSGAYGYKGGTGTYSVPNYSAGGGGGAGGTGNNASSATSGGGGGAGIQISITGTASFYGGGGGGAIGYLSGSASLTAGTGGSGIGGNGGNLSTLATAGQANTGSGGGGGGFVASTDYASGAGGSGIVIIRVLNYQNNKSGIILTPKPSNNITIEGVVNNSGNVDGVISTTSTERLRILSTGNIGIGTSNPTTTLDVNGTITGTTINATGNLQENSVNLSSKYLALTGGTLTGAGSLTGTTINATGNLQENSVNLSSKYLLLNGTSTMTGTLNLHKSGVIAPPSATTTGGTGDRIVLYQGETGLYPYSLGINGSTLWYSVPTGAKHSFFINGTEQLTITSTNVNIPKLVSTTVPYLFSINDLQPAYGSPNVWTINITNLPYMSVVIGSNDIRMRGFEITIVSKYGAPRLLYVGNVFLYNENGTPLASEKAIYSRLVLGNNNDLASSDHWNTLTLSSSSINHNVYVRINCTLHD